VLVCEDCVKKCEKIRYMTKNFENLTQFFHKMQEEIDVEEALIDGDVSKITTWLKENIHQYGSSKNAKELLKDVTGEELNTKYYIDYLTEKYSKLYEL